MKHKYKIIVYAICKNEEKFIKRWINSMKEADDIYVLDTGSTDNSVKLLKEGKVHVTQKQINPFRFDTARNESLKLVPEDTDICVCTDIDEVFNKGWRNLLEQNWENDLTRVKYKMNWSFDENNKPQITYYQSKIHTRYDYIWTHPVHEVIENINNNEKVKTINNLTINHYPDKTKSRNSYLPLLELAVKENNKDDRNMHYLGREYMYYHKNNKAIKTLKKHLKLKSSTWKEERATSMRFIARCYNRQNKLKKAEKWYNKSIKEAPNLRDSYVEKALLEYTKKEYDKVIDLCTKALSIKNNNKYINESFSYDGTIEDLLSLCYYYKKNKELALYYIEKAIAKKPNDKRLKTNKEYFKD